MGLFSIKSLLLFDPLSLFFLFVIAVISLPSAVYSIGYMKGEYSAKKTSLGWFLLVVFIGSMAAVVTVSNAFVFLIAWEVMSLVSYFLVVFDDKHEKSVAAGTIYIIMTHIGTAFITFAFLIMFKYAGSFDFIAIKQASAIIPSNIKNLIFIFLLIGFGTKAGIVPLHVWLPYAHPQAPSHISSIMSGVMIKTAIYGILRFVIFILGVNAVWWGNLILILALVSCLVGVIYALMENDLKKLLAYSSVENMGIILLGVGASMVFLKMDMPVLAVFALIAGLYHLVNHAIFKGLLFLCAGAVYKATGTRNIEKLGGLIKLMPWTAVFFLIGSMAVSGIVPFNGFISEWLTLQAFFQGAASCPGGYKIFMSICAAGLALTAGLALACFVKAFGITFLALPRSKKAQAAKEVSPAMTLSMLFLSLLALAFGLCAAIIIKILTVISASAIGVSSEGINFSINNFTLSPQASSGIFLSSPILAFILALTAGAVAIGVYLCFGKNKATVNKTWGCGYYNLDARAEYTSTAFSKPFRIAFSFFLLPYTKTEKIKETAYYVKSFKYELYTTPIFKRYIYEPIIKSLLNISSYMRRFQPGSIHIYIAYIFVTIILLIVFMNRF